nr:valacyclovir hydrolase-like isoform X1 [Leptinotarsa decemlineata]
MTNTNEQKIKIIDKIINYIKVGKGTTNILCLPGALGTIWSDFKPQIEGLDKSKFTLIVWDPPGYGQSRPPDRQFGTSFYENDAHYAYELMKKLQINRFSLLGWSDGGISAIIMASKYPQNVEKLVIWGVNSYIIQQEIEYYNSMRDISRWSEKIKGPLVALYTEKELQKMWSKWCDTAEEFYNKGGNICSNWLKLIQCPTLILHGDKDPMMSPEHPEFLFCNIKAVMLHRFPEGKHNVHLRFSEEFNKLVTDFLLL